MENRIEVASIKLAIQFSEDSDIPSRFKEKEKEKKNKKVNLNTDVEKRFQEKVKGWSLTITNMLSKIDNNQAWRFICLSPSVQPNIKSAAYHSDFIEFTDYFVLRRDIENCDYVETGCLASLHTEFQNVIEREI